MARLLISFPATIFDQGQYRLAVFYEGFLKALYVNGNELFILNSAEYLPRSWDGENILRKEIFSKRLISDIIDFNPELIITFNHSIPKIILESTSCKVAVWDADSIEFYNDKDYIKKHIDRYEFLTFSETGIDSAKKFGAAANKIHLIYAGTEVQAENIPLQANISFIGSTFTVDYELIKQLNEKSSEKMQLFLKELNQNFFTDHYSIIKKHNMCGIEKKISAKMLASLSAVHNRITTLNIIEPLGLKLYGNKAWYDVGLFLPWLALSYVPQKVYSLKHNQDIYNSSKIALNISHSQATSGFPWRVFDILASNACLVSDHSSELEKVTKGYVDIPYYDNPIDAYNICNKILSDKIWRDEIVSGSQLFIKENGRWIHRFKELSDIFGLNFISEKKQAEDSLEFYRSIRPAKKYYHLHTKLIKKVNVFIIKKAPKKLLRIIYKILVFLHIKISPQFLIEAVDLKKTISVKPKT